MPKLLLIVIALLASFITPALADDWTALKLRGVVLELVDGTWQPIGRGAAVPETHVVRTLANGRVLFQRGTETVELGPDTQVQIFQRGHDRFTTVKQYFGEVTVEADIEKVKHFAVQAPQLVAVVKGTIFTVRSDGHGASVAVKRGAVAVTSTTDRSSVTVRAGQEASTDDTGALEVAGTGALPTVVDAKGKPVDVAESDVGVKSNNGKSDDKDNKGKGNNSGSNDNGSGKEKEHDDDSSGSGGSVDNEKSGHDGNGNSDHGSDGNSGHGSSGKDKRAEDD